jgi:hypothetical protein
MPWSKEKKRQTNNTMVKRKVKTEKQYHGQKKRQTNNTMFFSFDHGIVCLSFLFFSFDHGIVCLFFSFLLTMVIPWSKEKTDKQYHGQKKRKEKTEKQCHGQKKRK